MWYRNKDFWRATIAALGYIGAVFLPPWVPMAAMVTLALLSAGWEVPLLGLFVDLLWLPALGIPQPLPIFTLSGIALAWIFEPLRREFLVQ